MTPAERISARSPALPGAVSEPYLAIVVGGSSGGIEALLHILPALPAALRAAVLVVLHLPRDKRSLLVDIFQPRCPLPLSEAQDKDVFAPGSVTFAPPDYHLLVDHGPEGTQAALSLDAPEHFSRPSIDVLFESAADHYGSRLVGILLSGANEDGARGMRAIHAAGGLTIAQAPDSASVSTMPQAAIAALAADFVLPPQDIAALLNDLHRQDQL